METVGKLIAAALICCALNLLLRKQAPELTLAQTIEICSGFLCIYLALPLLEMVLSLLQTMIGG